MKELIKELLDLEKEKALVEADIDAVKAKIEAELEPGKGYKDDNITISYYPPTTSVSIDMTALKNKEPELYEELRNDYKKTSNSKGYYRYNIKKEK